MRRCRIFLVLSVLLGFVWASPNCAWAFSNLNAKLPLPADAAKTATPGVAIGKSALTGLSLEVVGGWFERGGYVPVTFHFEGSTPAPRDREIEIVLYGADTGILQGRHELKVAGSVTLREGETTASCTLLCPLGGALGFVWWDVTVDGGPEPRLSVDKSTPMQAGFANQSVSEVNLLIPEVGVLRRASAGAAKQHPPLAGLTIDEARSEWFDRWLAYSSVDVVLLDLEELRTEGDDPGFRDRIEPVRDWVLAGGTLWIQMAGKGAGSMREIDRLLGIGGWRLTATAEERSKLEPVGVVPSEADREAPVEADQEEGDTPARAIAIEGAPGWRHDRLAKARSGKEQAQDLVNSMQRSGLEGGVRWLTGQRDSRGWYAARDLGFGRVIAFEMTPFAYPEFRLKRRNYRPPARVAEAVQEWRSRAWPARHGLSDSGASAEYGDWLIPGVGVAPVGEFQVLITLFVLVIGPLNYWWLWRRGKRQLLVLTAPLIAAAVTLSLLGYALVSDGFGVTVRARSVTMLNQQAGEAVSWGRVSHYAGIAPREGLDMPGDAAVYPIRPIWESAIAPSSQAQRGVDWRGDRQELTGGWFPSRTAVQHLVVRSGSCDARLSVAEEGERLRVVNRLGVEATLLLVLDRSGGWRFCEELAAGASATPEPLSRLEATKLLRVMVLDNEPELPVGAGDSAEDALRLLGESRLVRRRNRSLVGVALEDNLLNRELRRVAGLEGGAPLDLPPGSFVVVARESVHTPLGCDAEEQGSFHLVVGRW